jgi:hypothetical protein
MSSWSTPAMVAAGARGAVRRCAGGGGEDGVRAQRAQRAQRASVAGCNEAGADASGGAGDGVGSSDPAHRCRGRRAHPESCEALHRDMTTCGSVLAQHASQPLAGATPGAAMVHIAVPCESNQYMREPVYTSTSPILHTAKANASPHSPCCRTNTIPDTLSYIDYILYKAGRGIM